MAEFNIQINNTIVASIVDGNRVMDSCDTIILDPITESYSTIGTLNFYELTIINIGVGVTRAEIFNNGKNSRFSGEGSGSVIVQLEVRDDEGFSKTATIQITIN